MSTQETRDDGYVRAAARGAAVGDDCRTTNVGKATSSTASVGERRSIVATSRGSRATASTAKPSGKANRFAIVDTGGSCPTTTRSSRNILKQAATAIGEAVAIVWVVDVRAA